MSRRVVYSNYEGLRDRADVLSGLIAYWRQSVRMKSVEQAGAFLIADVSQRRFLKGNYLDVLGLLNATPTAR